MARILHLCSWFDPAGDVVRCVNELRKHSKHEHDLIVRERHPSQDIMRLPEPESFAPEYDSARIEKADAIICHFVGWPPVWPEPFKVPMAFRNINIRYNGELGKSWCENQYNVNDQERYSLFAASHVGGEDFFPGKKFRWLPDLLDIFSPELTPDWTDSRYPCVSYIKHANALDFCDFGATMKQNLSQTAHAEIIDRRKRLATVVVDNLCDGHWGLSGQESIALGLPTLVYNSDKTRTALREYVGVIPGWNDRLDHPSLPFGEMNDWVEIKTIGVVSEMNEIIDAARILHSWPKEQYEALRRDIRAWTERHFASEKLIGRFWDPFCDELLES